MTPVPSSPSDAVWRVRLLAISIGLAALTFGQRSGEVVPDTKLDLTLNPVGFLERALHLWDPMGFFGQVQNQAYGYLFPVGPIHAGLQALGLAPWIVQRLWWTLVLLTAFWGVWKLTGAMVTQAPWPRVLAALLYALSPRMVSEVAITSVEVWPMAVAPWVLLPLVDRTPRSWPQRILWSAAAVGVIGGVNAVATGAALVLPALWFATRRPLWEGIRWGLAWLAAVTVAISWWLVPLLLLGRFSPPFLDWIEDAGVTTSTATPWAALRGVTPWVSYLSDFTGPEWPGGHVLINAPPLIVITGMIAVGGLVGVLLLPRRHRTFASLGLVVGLALVTLGHTGPGGSFFAGPVQDSLDGPLAPLRNAHKFELVMRLVLTIGLARLLAVGVPWARHAQLPRWLVPLCAVAMALGTAAPALTGVMARPEGYEEIPDYWRTAADHLNDSDIPGTVLVVPGAPFAKFSWGTTRDEPFQALLERPFAVRDAVPLGSAGSTRAMDAIERSLSTGEGNPAVVAQLRSAGIGAVVVRNDLRPGVSAPRSVVLHHALARAGLSRTAQFGPPTSVPGEDIQNQVDARLRLPYPAIEIFEVPDAGDAWLIPSDAMIAAPTAGAEDVGDVLSAHPGAKGALVGSDAAGASPEAPLVLVDGNQKRAAAFGSAGGYSDVLQVGDRGSSRVSPTYMADPQSEPTVRVGRDELDGVDASSSASDADATNRLGSGYGPAALVDNDPGTVWMSGDFGEPVGQWVELQFSWPLDLAGTQITLGPEDNHGARPTRVAVTSDTGETRSTLSADDGAQPLVIPPGLTSSLRLTIEEVADADAVGVAIAEVSLPRRYSANLALAVPAVDQRPDAVVLRETAMGTHQCVAVGERPLCDPSIARQPEHEGGIRRNLDVGEGGRFELAGLVRPVNGAAVERLIDQPGAFRMSASSRMVQEPAGRPESAADGLLGTGWVAAPGDEEPSLSIRFGRAQTVSEAQLVVDEFLAASRPTEVEVILDGRSVGVSEVDQEGRLSWPRAKAKTVELRFVGTSKATNMDSVTGFSRVQPVGISEVLFDELSAPSPLDLRSPVGAACGFGPPVQVNGEEYATAVRGTVGQVLLGEPLELDLCDDSEVALPSGELTFDVLASAEFTPVSVRLTPEGMAHAPDDGERSMSLQVNRTSPAELEVAVESRDGEQILAIPQNFNPGWEAHDASGAALRPVRVNGWQQGWSVPSGQATTITAQFAPASEYRAGLLVGGLSLLGLFGAAGATRWRRFGDLKTVGGAPPSAGWLVLIAVVLVLATGWSGLVAVGTLAAGLMLVRLSGRMAVHPVWLLVVGGVLVATWAGWRAYHGDPAGGVAQLLAVFVIAVAVLGGEGVSLRRPHRINGRSTP